MGSLERSHHTFVVYLRHYCEETDWNKWLPVALFSFNTTVHESTEKIPDDIFFGRKVRFPPAFAGEEVPMTIVQYVDNLFNRIVEIESLVSARLKAAKIRCKKYYDWKVNTQKFELDQYVYLLISVRPL